MCIRDSSKGSSIQHIQRQQILYAVGILCLQQALEHKAGAVSYTHLVDYEVDRHDV